MVKKYLWLFSIVSLSVVFFDQISKFLVVSFKPYWYSPFISIHLVTNTGAGFGILQGSNALLAIISFLVALGIILFYKKLPQTKYEQIFIALFLGGAIGNLVDRVFRGFVVDFIDLSWWPAFNLADSALVVAVVGLVILSFSDYIKKTNNK